jgi:hypothetical protein
MMAGGRSVAAAAREDMRQGDLPHGRIGRQPAPLRFDPLDNERHPSCCLIHPSANVCAEDDDRGIKGRVVENWSSRGGRSLSTSIFVRLLSGSMSSFPIPLVDDRQARL